MTVNKSFHKVMFQFAYIRKNSLKVDTYFSYENIHKKKGLRVGQVDGNRNSFNFFKLFIMKCIKK